MTRPLLTIGIPFFNYRRYLLDAVRSIFAQTFTDWELILVDDGSTDGSIDIANSIDDPRVRVLPRDGKNLFLASRLNQIVKNAKGEYIARMDADDVSLATRLEKQIGLLRTNPNVDVVGTGSFTVDLEWNPFIVCRPPPQHAAITRHPSMHFVLLHGSIIGKTEWFRRWKYNPHIRLAQDFDLFFRSYRYSTFANVPEPLYVIRFAGVTTKLTAKYKSVYYKSMALVLNGFRTGLFGQTLLGLASMAPRPLLYTLKAACGRHRKGLVKSKGIEPSDDDKAFLARELELINKAEVPLKKGV